MYIPINRQSLHDLSLLMVVVLIYVFGMLRFLSRYRIQCILGPGLVFILVHTLMITSQYPPQVRLRMLTVGTCSSCFLVLEFQ